METQTHQEKQKRETLEHLYNVLKGLEEDKGLTYSELFEKSDLSSKRTFNERLQELEDKGIVLRDHINPDEGRAKTVIKLSPDAREDSIRRTVSHLSSISPYGNLPFEEGRKWLTEEGKELLWTIATRNWLEESGEFIIEREEFWKTKEIVKEDGSRTKLHELFEFNEYWLIRGLARYYVEAHLIPMLAEGRKAGEKVFPKTLKETEEGEEEHDYTLYFEFFKDLFPFDNQKELAEFYEKELKNGSDLLPVVKEVGNSDLEKNLEELLKWIRPLLSVPHIRAEGDSGRNLVSAVFQNERDEYIKEVLNPAWKGKRES